MSDGSAKETGLAIPTGLEQATSRLVPPIEVPNSRGKPIKLWPNPAYLQAKPNDIVYGAWLFQEPHEGEFMFFTAPVTMSGNPEDDGALMREMEAQGIDPKQARVNCTKEAVARKLTPTAVGTFEQVRSMIKEGFVALGKDKFGESNRSSGWSPDIRELYLVGHPRPDGFGSRYFVARQAIFGNKLYGRNSLPSLSDPIEPTTNDPVSVSIIGKVLKANLAKK